MGYCDYYQPWVETQESMRVTYSTRTKEIQQQQLCF